jgi:hypothetical protein
MREGSVAWLATSEYTPETTLPHTGTHSLYRAGASNGISRAYSTPQTGVCGFKIHFYVDGIPSGGSSYFFVVADSLGGWQISCRYLLNGGIEIYRGNADTGVLIASSDAAVIPTRGWVCLDAKYKIHNSAGLVGVKVNGVEVVSESGIDTQTTSRTEASIIGLFLMLSGCGAYHAIDDVIAWYDDGGDNSDYIGDYAVDFVPLDADTAQTDWVRNAGATDVSCVNEAAPDDDSTYIQSTTVGDKSDFTIGALDSAIEGIIAVLPFIRARKTETGAGGVRIGVVASGGATAFGSDIPLATTWANSHAVIQRNPDHAGTPGIARTDLQNMKFRIERRA